jgi:D-alanyl-D-alanine endopeptidase (penicillin-binding protein 7)
LRAIPVTAPTHRNASATARPTPPPLRFPTRPLLIVLSLLLAIIADPALAKAKSKGKPREDLTLRSNSVLVVDQDSGEVLIAKNADVVAPIASLTKLMTALVVVEAKLPMDEMLTLGKDDLDREKHTQSRLKVGSRLSRSELMLLALMSSENVAALALGRNYPGGRTAFVAKMNEKAASLGMKSTRFADPAGLSSRNVSTARDLLRLLAAADSQEMIRRYTTQPEATVRVRGGPVQYVNSNRMVRSARDWQIGLQKTGFTNEAGRCMVMRATTLDRRLSMVFLNSFGTLTRFADAGRVRKILQKQQRELPRPQPILQTVSTEKAAS